MFITEYSYYVFHKVQIGSKGNITEASRIVTRETPILTIGDVQGVCKALASSHSVQEGHVMVVSWQFLQKRTLIVKTFMNWILRALATVTGTK